MRLGIFVFIHRISPLPIGKKNEKLSVLFLQICYFSPEKKPQWSHTSLQFQKRSQGQLCLSRCSDLLRPKSAIKSEISICRAQTFLIQFYQKQMICDIQFIAIYSYFRSTIILFECVFLKKHLNQYLQIVFWALKELLYIFPLWKLGTNFLLILFSYSLK